MALDALKNAAYSLVATAPSPATSGLSLVVTAGEGARFPTGSFDLTVWPAGAQPLWVAGGSTAGNFEICRATVSGDTITLVRAQYGTTARSIQVGDQVAVNLTAAMLSQIETMAVGGALTGSLPNPTLAPGAAQNLLSESLVSSALAESIPRWAADSNDAILSTGRLTAIAVAVLAGTVCTSMSFLSATTAIITATNWWFALVDSSFNLIRQSTDQLATAWAANTLKTLPLDSVPVTAGARAGSSTVTLTFPTMSQPLSSLFANGDSIKVSNANIVAYNGTFTVVSVGASTITYVAGGSATDSLSAPFPTVQLAAGKQAYTVPSNGIVYAVVMVKAATVPSLAGHAGLAALYILSPLLVTNGDSSLTGTCPGAIAHASSTGSIPYAVIS